MRTVIITGPGGTGSSTVARGLAHRYAEEGRRTLLLRERRLGDPSVPEDAAGDGPATRLIDPLQWGAQVWDALAPVRALVGPPWQSLDGTTVLALPPLRELAWWGALRSAWHEQWDAVVVDGGPINEAVRWLTLPDLTVGLLRRTWPLTDRTGEAADRLQAGSWHLRAMARLDSEAAELADVMRSSATAIHLVTVPRQHEIGRALQALTPLALFEMPVTDLIVNRVQPRRNYDRQVIERLPGQLAGLSVRTAAAHRGAPAASVIGREIYSDVTPSPRPQRPRVGRTGEEFIWSWPLPFAQPDAVSAAISGDDVILTVDGQRRVVALPSVLRRCQLRSATFAGPVLRLSFLPDPTVWPASREVP